MATGLFSFILFYTHIRQSTFGLPMVMLAGGCPPSPAVEQNGCSHWFHKIRTFCAVNTTKIVQVAFIPLQLFSCIIPKQQWLLYVQRKWFNQPLLRKFIPSLIRDVTYHLHPCPSNRFASLKEFKILFRKFTQSIPSENQMRPRKAKNRVFGLFF